MEEGVGACQEKALGWGEGRVCQLPRDPTPGCPGQMRGPYPSPLTPAEPRGFCFQTISSLPWQQQGGTVRWHFHETPSGAGVLENRYLQFRPLRQSLEPCAWGAQGGPYLDSASSCPCLYLYTVLDPCALSSALFLAWPLLSPSQGNPGPPSWQVPTDTC